MGKKLTYEFVKEHIESFGYKLKSKEYVNIDTKLDIVCSEGHEYSTIFYVFKKGHRCPKCSAIRVGGLKKLKYEDIKKYIESYGYELISTQYKSARDKIEVKCDKGHKSYHVTYDSFQQGHRCDECAWVVRIDKRRLDYEFVKEKIESVDGYKLISKEYSGNMHKLKIECPVGHRLNITYSNFQSGVRCKACYHKIASEQQRFTIDQVREYMLQHPDYELLSEEYVNSHTKLDFKCPKGHIFRVGLSAFKYGKRCAKCTNERMSKMMALSYEFVYNFVKSRNFTMLGKEYKNSHTRFLVKCNDKGHIFKTTYGNLKKGNGCPHCRTYKGEAAIKKILDSSEIKYEQQYTFRDCICILMLKFDFAIFDNKNNLIALIEHQGEQHFMPVDFGGKGKKHANKVFEGTQKRDNIKKEYCQKNNIPLIYTTYKDINNIEEILKKELAKYKITI